MRRMGLALMICSSWGVGAAHADDFSPQKDKVSTEAVANLEAYAVYKMGRYDQARAIWEDLAAKGNTTAMINLSNMFGQGQGTPPDQAKALEWTRQAAQGGDSRAQVELGWAHERGQGVPHDNHLAAEWFRKAALQQDRDGAFNLGVMLATNYGQGLGSGDDAQMTEARTWLSLAAQKGKGEAADYLKVLDQKKP